MAGEFSEPEKFAKWIKEHVHLAIIAGGIVIAYFVISSMARSVPSDKANYSASIVSSTAYRQSSTTSILASTTSVVTTTTIPPTTTTTTQLRNSQWLFSNGAINVGSGSSGQLSVVSAKTIDTNHFYSLVAFTFRNNTSKVASSISASLRVFDSGGGLFLTDNSISGDVQPLAVQPGEWGFGYFHIDPIPSGSRLDIQLSSNSSSSRSNLKIVNATTRSDSSGVQSSAVISNTSSNSVIANANFLCLDQNGFPVGFGNERLLLPESQRRIGSEFTISTHGVGLETKSCPVLAVFAYS